MNNIFATRFGQPPVIGPIGLGGGNNPFINRLPMPIGQPQPVGGRFPVGMPQPVMNGPGQYPQPMPRPPIPAPVNFLRQRMGI